MNSADRRKAMTAGVQAEMKTKLENLSRQKQQAMQDIEKICSAFIDHCLRDNVEIQQLTDYDTVKSLSQDLDVRITRMSNFLTELPLRCQELYEKDVQWTTPLSIYGDEKSIDSLPSLKDVDSDDVNEFLALMAQEASSPVPSVESQNNFVEELQMETLSLKPEHSNVLSIRKKKGPNYDTLSDRNDSVGGSSSGFFSSKTKSSERMPPIRCKPPSPLIVTVPKSCAADVTHINSPSHFFVQLREMKPQLDQLDKELSEQMMLRRQEVQPLEWSMVGGPAIVFLSDYSNYFRGWTRRVIKSDSTIEVFFIDWGNVDCVPLHYCFVMPEKFANLPAAAVSCCLQRVPCDNLPNNHVEFNWPASATEAFIKSFRNTKVHLNFLRSYDSIAERPKDMYQLTRYDVNLFCGSNGSDAFSKLLAKKYLPCNL